MTSSNNEKNFGIGLAGCGTVGTGVIRALQRNGELIRQRTGGQMTMAVKRVLVRDATKSRDEAVDATINHKVIVPTASVRGADKVQGQLFGGEDRMREDRMAHDMEHAYAPA